MTAPTDASPHTNEAVLPLIPAPRSALWETPGTNDWVTSDPFAEVTVGINTDLPVTEYALSINREGASITAGSETALADGRNTFAQIVHLATTRPHATSETPIDGSAASDASQPFRIPGVVISDAPARAWRGLMVDVARHFMPCDALKRIIEAMALYRLNVLHLHLTDDQGWRVEINGYPKLTEVGAWRERTVEGIPSYDDSDTYAEDGHGGFYTQEELSELVEYARERGVMLVPEISIPGHVQAAIAAYPQFGNFPTKQLLVRETWGESQHVLGTGDAAFQFVRDVLTQVADIFDSPFIHIGGDDVPLTEWETSPEARTRRQEWGYTRESEILGHFTEFAADVLRSKEKRAIMWDSAHLVRVPDNAIIMHRGDHASLAAVAQHGFQCVAASDLDLGLDRVQGKGEPVGAEPELSLKNVYTRRLLPTGLEPEQDAFILGLHAHATSEYIPTPTHMEYMLFPRLIAVAQRAWGATELSYEELHERLYSHEAVLATLGIESRKVGV